MRAFMTITSTAATRPPPICGSSRWLTTPRSTPARIARITSCFTAREEVDHAADVSAASIVCIVEKTRWPDSAALSAVWAVSASRSSPIRITSGSWRSARRSAARNDSVSSPTSRWLTMQPRSECRISIGSSIVMMCCCRVAVDVVDHGRERGRLARAGRAGDEHEAAVLLGEALHALRQAAAARSSARASGSRGRRTRSSRAGGSR